MELPPLTVRDEELGAPFEWSELLNFTIDDELLLNLDVSDNNQQKDQPIEAIPNVKDLEKPNRGDESGSSDRVRKRDPRMVCENFLAGIVPCACPEMDAMMMEEEEEVGPGKKRPRLGRTLGVAKCQVPRCEADIRELKGYHRRHRVCLICANASSVLIDGDNKRYCQQCGKFHVLSDFDEGKRSCRRKLERHNNRRRRKSADSRGAVEKDSQGNLLTEDVSDGEPGKGNNWSSSQIAVREDSKYGTLSNLCSALESQNIENDSISTFSQGDKVKDNSEPEHSPPSDTKTAYSSVCPTGRISFKLYDWNPAEFPRRLRHQIFQWLSSMPVELEGYIRPGCTIMTMFVSMPRHMWLKLYEDPVSYIQSSVGLGGILSGRGAAFVYLNDRSFCVMRDGASVMEVKVAIGSPKLHYVYPPCFVAGKPMDFLACGSNILQPKFRSLISFGGKYLAHDYYVAFPRGRGEDEYALNYDFQYCRIYVPHTEPTYFGPAFIEVENECGLSNFIPVLIGDERVCYEIKMIHQKYDCSCCRKQQCSSSGSSYGTCEVSCSRQAALSEFMLDVAWLLKKPCSEKLYCSLTSSQIQKLNCLLTFLISNKCTSILEKALQSLDMVHGEMDSNENETSFATDTDRMLFMKYMADAREFLQQSACENKLMLKSAGDCILETDVAICPSGDLLDHAVCQAAELRAEMNCTSLENLDSQRDGESIALLNKEVAMNVNNYGECSTKSCKQMITKKFIISRPFIYMIAVVAVCFGVCAVVFHPSKVTRFAVTIRCVFDNSS